MAKKLGITLLAGAVLALVFLPDILYFTAKKAFAPENRNTAWAPKTAYNAGKMYQRFFRFNSARAIYRRCVETWPQAGYLPECYYRIAFCYEKAGDGEKALAAYDDFIGRYPNHPLADQARRRITYVKANE